MPGMSEEAVKPEPDSNAEEQDESQDARWWDYQWPDSLLTLLASLADMPGIGAPVTLTVDGLVIEGDLVSGAAYLEHMADKLGGAEVNVHGAEQSDLQPGIDNAMQSIVDMLRTDAEAYREKRRDDVVKVHLHLADVVIWGDAGTVVRRLEFWRGRLIDVSGWSLGRSSKES